MTFRNSFSTMVLVGLWLYLSAINIYPSLSIANQEKKKNWEVEASLKLCLPLPAITFVLSVAWFIRNKSDYL